MQPIKKTVLIMGLSSVGVIVTAVLAARGHSNYQEEVYRFRQQHGDDPERRDKVAMGAKHYFPAVGSGIITIAGIMTSGITSYKHNIALATAYSSADTMLTRYRSKLESVLSKEDYAQFRGEAQYVKPSCVDDHQSHPSAIENIAAGVADPVLMYDSLTGRFFYSSIEKVRWAENLVNKEILQNMYADQNMFYSLIGLPPVPVGDDLGWNLDHECEVHFNPQINDEGRPFIRLDYSTHPFKHFYKEG